MMTPKDYAQYEVEDLLTDESFLAYCRHENEKVVEKWNAIVNEYPELAAKVSEAMKLYEWLSGNQRELSDEKERLLNRIELDHPSRVIRLRRFWWAAAAIVAILTWGTISFLNHENQKQQIAHQDTLILPGSNKAYLELGDGRRILLDSLQNGEIANRGGAILSQIDGTISYQPENSRSEAAEYNTIRTPLGGQFQVILADGTHVWLNAGSSLKYPTRFNGTERRVELTGEGYFDVSKNPLQPFIVSTGNASIRVKGTSFNVNAYSDEPILKTTLVHGAVTVSVQNQSINILPGQQAVITQAGALSIISDVDLGAETAWKDGKFVFHNDNIRTVMRQLARWYDIEVTYSNGISNDEFVGVISRYASLSDVLKMLQTTETVQFKTEGKKITVMPYKK